MTSPEELSWNHAVELEDFELAQEIVDYRQASKDQEQATDDPEVSGALKTQQDILRSALYWDMDYGSLRDGTP